jgi:hypothetical protein
MPDVADIKELAVAAWRLEKWVDNLNYDRKMAAKSALRSIKKFLTASGIEIRDPVGSKFDPGLAIEVVNNESEDADNEENLIIIETISPYLYQNGELIQYARVIIGTELRENRETVVETEETVMTDQQVGKSESASENQSDAESDIVIDEKDIERMMAYAKNI